MRLSRLAITVGTAFAVAACATVSTPSPACSNGETMVETQLFFGLSKPRGGVVGAAQWDQFVASEITPRFPEGFSVIDGAGFWRDGATQRTISEKSKIVVRLHPASTEADQAIGAIIDAYKNRFRQQAVLRVDRPVCAQF